MAQVAVQRVLSDLRVLLDRNRGTATGNSLDDVVNMVDRVLRIKTEIEDVNQWVRDILGHDASLNRNLTFYKEKEFESADYDRFLVIMRLLRPIVVFDTRDKIGVEEAYYQRNLQAQEDAFINTETGEYSVTDGSKLGPDLSSVSYVLAYKFPGTVASSKETKKHFIDLAVRHAEQYKLSGNVDAHRAQFLQEARDYMSTLLCRPVGGIRDFEGAMEQLWAFAVEKKPAVFARPATGWVRVI